MDSLPRVVGIRINSGRKILGSFIDAEWVLHYIAAGTWSFRLENRRHRVRAGDLVLLPPRLLHVVQPRSRPPLVQYVVHFDFAGRMARSPFPRVSTLPPGRRREARELFHRLARETASGLPFRETVAGGLLAALLGLHFRHAAAPAPGEREELPGWAHVEAALACLHRRHAEGGLSLRNVAKASGLSLNYLCRLFRQGTGHTVMRYLTDLRLQRAEELLLRSRLNCTQIAEAVGYSGVHLLSRHFARHRGLSPTAFRRRHAPRLGRA